MAMTTREAFERGTDTFNAHDIAMLEQLGLVPEPEAAR
jgi:hypothetical protein